MDAGLTMTALHPFLPCRQLALVSRRSGSAMASATATLRSVGEAACKVTQALPNLEVSKCRFRAGRGITRARDLTALSALLRATLQLERRPRPQSLRPLRERRTTAAAFCYNVSAASPSSSPMVPRVTASSVTRPRLLVSTRCGALPDVVAWLNAVMMESDVHLDAQEVVTRQRLAGARWMGTLRVAIQQVCHASTDVCV